MDHKSKVLILMGCVATIGSTHAPEVNVILKVLPGRLLAGLVCVISVLFSGHRGLALNVISGLLCHLGLRG